MYSYRVSLAAVGSNSTGTGTGDQGKKKGNAGVGGEHGSGIGVSEISGAGAGNGLDGLDGLDGSLECCNLEEVRAWGSSFDKLMRSAAGRKLFREFLVSEYSEENIAFWLACEQLKRESNPETIEEKARYIYEDYISILSPKEVSSLISRYLYTLLFVTNDRNSAKALRREIYESNLYFSIIM